MGISTFERRRQQRQQTQQQPQQSASIPSLPGTPPQRQSPRQEWQTLAETQAKKQSGKL